MPWGCDNLTDGGAKALASEIEAFWLERGYRVRCWTEVVPFGPGKEPLFCVRSDLVAGMPVAMARAA